MSGQLAVGFDDETTGLIDNGVLKLDKQPEVIEFYACLFDMDTGKIKKELDLLIKPKHAISEEITRITGITNEMVADAKPFRHHVDAVVAMLQSAPVVVAHNLSYDMEMIELELKRCEKTIKWPMPLCTVEQTLHMKGFRLSLGALYELLFNEPFVGAHRASADVKAMVRCVVELRKRGEL